MLLMEHWGYIKTELFELRRVTKISCIKEFDKSFIQIVSLSVDKNLLEDIKGIKKCCYKNLCCGLLKIYVSGEIRGNK